MTHHITQFLTLSGERLEAIGHRLERDVASGAIAGATVAIGRRNGIAFERSVGFRDVATRDRLQPDAVWRIFSMTKPLVTAAAMILIERGELRLDQSVAERLPEFAHLRVAQTDRRIVFADRSPTIQDLMRHTAGLAYGYLGDSPATKALQADGFLREDLPLAQFVTRLAALPLEHPPGTVWHYSHATEVLGRVLEVVVGRDLGTVLRELIFAPLGMDETGFVLPQAQRGRIAEPLPQPPGARPRFFDPTVARRHQSAGGGLVSTAADYVRFLRMMLGGGRLDDRRFLAPATIALMTADHLGQNIGRAAYYPPGPGYGFGLGFAVRTTAGEAPFSGSVGDYFWSGVGGTYFWVDPALDLFALLMLQSSSPGQRLHYRTLLRNLVYAAVE
jgi:CubicO group peptidase (beta-lactamase class C family)